jgi:hypothetical protein
MEEKLADEVGIIFEFIQLLRQLRFEFFEGVKAGAL